MNRAILAVLVSILIGCNNTTTDRISVPPDTVSLLNSAWVFSFSPNMPTHPVSTGTAWKFTFPNSDGVHYLMVPYSATKPHTTLTIKYKVSGTGKFVSVDDPCDGPGFTPILERQGDSMSPGQDFYRFWGEQVLLKSDNQVHTVSYPLTWNNWTGVYGVSNRTEFNTTMENLMGVGITFGGCYAGHGVYVTGGPVTFELLDFTIK